MRALLTLVLAINAFAADSAPVSKEDRSFASPKTHAIFTIPAGFQEVVPKENHDINYMFGFKHPEKAFEVRFHYDPPMTHEKGAQGKVDLEAPTDAWAKTIQGNMNMDIEVPFNPYPADAVAKEFGADWGYLSQIFPLDPKHDFNGSYKYGLVSYIHKKGAGSYAQIFLFDAVDTFKALNSGVVYHSVMFHETKMPKPHKKAKAKIKKKKLKDPAEEIQ